MLNAVTRIVFVLFALPCLAQTNYPKNYFRSPLDGPLIVVGTFGEIRPDHFHSGLDLNTNEEEGKNVYAAASGHVSRIKIAPDGFGKAIYITHPNGYVTVYAHLKKFNPLIEKYISKLQYKNESFSIDHYLKPNELAIKKSDVIAFSGSTGGAEGPHLHFEIRDAKTEWIINPFLFGFAVADTVKPKITGVKIYSPRHEGMVINGFEPATYKVSDESGENKMLGPQPLNVFGHIGLGIEASDKTSAGEYYGLGIYSIELKLDTQRMYYFKYDTFSFDETRYANAHADYGEQMMNNSKIQRCFLLPGNKFSIDTIQKMKGELTLEDAVLHDAEFIVTDFAGNSTSFHLYLQSSYKLSDYMYPMPPTNVNVINEARGININTGDIHLKIPAGAVYEETWFTYSKTPARENALSALHSVGDKTVAMNNPISIEIKPVRPIDAALQSKTALVCHGKSTSLKYAGGEWKNGFVSATVRWFGEYEVMIDTIGPTIQSIMPLAVSQDLRMILQIKDALSGIGSYRATIDGKFFLMELDGKRGVLAGEIPATMTGAKHNFELVVTDKKGNSSSYSTTLIY